MANLVKAAVIIKSDNKFLLVQENTKRAKGLWNWPQGVRENNENLEDTAIRETKEETGFDIKILRKIVLLTETFPDTKELHVFLGSIVRGGLVFPPDEIMSVQFFNIKELEKIKNSLVGSWVYNIVSTI